MSFSVYYKCTYEHICFFEHFTRQYCTVSLRKKMIDLEKKVEILAGGAKYDVSCASSGSDRPNASKNGLGFAARSGICHSFSNDGRCISLLKILFSNSCKYDCAYCVNRSSNDIPRATFTVKELVNLTVEFYRRNYIEGLFLSSGVIRSPDYTMECLCRVGESLRGEHRFNGYIHMKVVPGTSKEIINRAALVADRVSVNIELPTNKSLSCLAPQKNKDAIVQPMKHLSTSIYENSVERKKSPKVPIYAPAGQSTQIIVGASPETDYQILHLSESLYKKMALKRVYYSAYIPVNNDRNLPVLSKPPLLREHRLYQADWLLRFYKFSASEIIDPLYPFLNEKFDPKVCWALQHLSFFPVEINTAEYWQLLRVPGIGVVSAQRIIKARRLSSLRSEDLQKIGVVMKRARYFITCNGFYGAPNRSFTRESLQNSIQFEQSNAPAEQMVLF